MINLKAAYFQIPHSSEFSIIFSDSFSKQYVLFLGTLLWPFCSSAGFHQDDLFGVRVGSQMGDSRSSVSFVFCFYVSVWSPYGSASSVSHGYMLHHALPQWP